MDPSVAREFWLRLEPVHAGVYFAPEARDVYAGAGLKGYWMGYFASRAAAFGTASAELVLATFYNFAEAMVRRAIPDAWTFSTPDRVLEARHLLARATVQRLVTDIDAATAAADMIEPAARAAAPEGRPLFAAHAALPWPDEPHLRLWHAATLLREHRGDGHIAVLVSEGIDGLESHLLAAAAGLIDPAHQRKNRGWTDEQWDDAVERLRARDILDGAGAFTSAGRALKQQIEARTDQLALAPYATLDDPAAAIRLLDTIRNDGGVPFPNAMALPQK